MMRDSHRRSPLWLRSGGLCALLAVILYLAGDFAHRLGHVHEHEDETTEQCVFEKLASSLAPPVTTQLALVAYCDALASEILPLQSPPSSIARPHERGPPSHLPL